MHSKKKQNISLILFPLPALAVYIVFKLYPAITGIFYSMTDWNGLSKEYDFVGLSNFVEMFSDDYYWTNIASPKEKKRYLPHMAHDLQVYRYHLIRSSQ